MHSDGTHTRIDAACLSHEPCQYWSVSGVLAEFGERRRRGGESDLHILGAELLDDGDEHGARVVAGAGEALREEVAHPLQDLGQLPALRRHGENTYEFHHSQRYRGAHRGLVL